MIRGLAVIVDSDEQRNHVVNICDTSFRPTHRPMVPNKNIVYDDGDAEHFMYDWAIQTPSPELTYLTYAEFVCKYGPPLELYF